MSISQDVNKTTNKLEKNQQVKNLKTKTIQVQRFREYENLK